MADFDYVSGNPDNLTGGGAANMVDIQGPLVDLKEWLNTDLQPRVAAAVPTLVTTLPTGAVDGQEIYYQNAVQAAQGRRWHFAYRAGNPTAYKWEFIGGRPYVSAPIGSVSMSVLSTYTAIPGMTSFTVPLDGVYDFEFGGGILQPNNSTMAGVFLYWSGVQQGSGARFTTVNAIGMNDYAMVAGVLSEASLTAGTVVELRYFTGGAATLYQPWMRMTAVRVG